MTRRHRDHRLDDGESDMRSGVNAPWFSAAPEDGAVRLLCFPQAGGGKAEFHAWIGQSPPGLTLSAIQLPGRENRIREVPFRRIEPLVKELCGALEPCFDRPFGFFGHSLGGWIAFEVARQLRRQQLPLPAHLFVSGCGAPQLPHRHAPIHNLPDHEFLDAVASLGGIPEDALRLPELMALLLPTLRADFEVYETYRYTDEPPLPCPITAMGGDADPRVSRDELDAWRGRTTDFALQMFPGTHFFLRDARTEILQRVARELMPRHGAS